jgi:hypothetical protein
MNNLTLFETSVQNYLRQLQNLTSVLKKGEEWVKDKKIEESVLINGRLAPDMFPLVRQIQIACDFAKASCARLGQIEIPSFPDNEKSFAELYERIQKTTSFLKTIHPQQINGNEERRIIYSAHGINFDFSGRDYLLNFALPNFFFHFTTAYDILRHMGVDLSKQDFIGKVN